jgi:lambda family phage tail tape measure protein
MADNRTNIRITATDETQTAIQSATAGIKKLETGMEGMQAAIARIPAIGAALAGAFTADAFIGMIKGSIEAADELDKLSQKTGATVEQLAGLKYAAKLNDTTLTGVADAAKKLSVNLAQTPELFSQLGIKSKDTVTQLVELSDTFKAMPDGATKVALAVKLLGKSGEEMIPFLNQGSDALRELIAQGEKMHPITTDQAHQAAELKDNMDKLHFASHAFADEMAARLLPGMAKASEEMANLAEHGDLLKASLVGLGAAMKLPWDLLFPPHDLKKELEVDGRLKTLREELGQLQRDAESAKGGGILNKWLFGTADEIQQKITATQNMIATLERHREELSKPITAPAAPTNKDEGLDPTGLINGYRELIKQMQERKTLLVAEIDNEAKLTDTQKFRAKILADMSNGNLRFTESQKANVKALLDTLTGMDQEIEKRKQLAMYLSQQRAMMNGLTGDFDIQMEAARRSMDVMSESQRQLGNELDKIAKAEQKARDAAEKDYQKNQNAGFADAQKNYQESMQKITEEVGRQREAVKALNDQQNQLNSTWQYGASKALQKFADEANNTAASIERVFTNALNGMADGLTQFVLTGKLDFNSLAQSIISDLVRIQIQKALVGLFGNFTLAGQYGTTAGSQQTAMIAAQQNGFDGGGFTGYGSRAGGLDGKGGFIAMLHPNETVLDHTKGQGMGGAVVLNDNTVINVDSRADRAQVINDVSRLIDSKQAQLVDRLQRRGALA